MNKKKRTVAWVTMWFGIAVAVLTYGYRVFVAPGTQFPILPIIGLVIAGVGGWLMRPEENILRLKKGFIPKLKRHPVIVILMAAHIVLLSHLFVLEPSIIFRDSLTAGEVTTSTSAYLRGFLIAVQIVMMNFEVLYMIFENTGRGRE